MTKSKSEKSSPQAQTKSPTNGAPEKTNSPKHGVVRNVLEPGFDLPLAFRVSLQSHSPTELESEAEDRRLRGAKATAVEAFLAKLPAARVNHAARNGLDSLNFEPTDSLVDKLKKLGSDGVSLAKTTFRERFGFSLRQHFIHTLPRDTGFVNILAFLAFGHNVGPEVAVGEAIIPTTVNDSNVLTALGNGVKDNHRDNLIRRYGKAFGGLGLGQDSGEDRHVLREHLMHAYGGIIDKLTNDDDTILAQSLALLDHDLTTAEMIYFKSLAVRGTHAKDVINLIQSTWRQGFSAFTQLSADWENFVRSRRGWKVPPPGKSWTNHSLKEALTDRFLGELSFEDRDIVLAIFDAYSAEAAVRASHASDSEEDKLEREEDLQIRAAKATLEAASSAFTSLANDEQIHKTIAFISQIWQARIARARRAKNIARVEQLERMFHDEYFIILGHKGAQSTLQARKTAVLLTIKDSLLDQVWAECQLGNYPEAIKLVTTGWMRGQMAQFHLDAATPRVEDGVIIRPAVAPGLLLPGKDAQFWRFFTLTNDKSPQPSPRAGANRLFIELGGSGLGGLDRRSDKSDSLLVGVHEFLKELQSLNPILLENVLSSFLERVDSATKPGRSREGFVAFLEHDLKFEQATNFENIRSLLIPPTNAKETSAQAHRELDAREKGIASGVVRFGLDVYADFTGERTRRVVERNLYLVDNLASDQADVQIRANEATDSKALLKERTAEFREALGRYINEQTAITDLISGAIELGVELGLSYLTGGQGLASVLSSIASTVLKQLTQEALLGENYQFYSPANVGDIIKTAVSAALFDVVDVRGKIENALEIEHSDLYRRFLESPKESRLLNAALGSNREGQAKILMNAFQNATGGIVDGIITTFTQFTTDALLLDKYPTPQTMAAELRRIAIYALSRAAHAPWTASDNPAGLKNDLLKFDDRLKVNYTFKLWVKELEGTGKKVAELLASDTSNLTIWEILEKVAPANVKGVITSYLKAYASAKGQQRRASARISEIHEILGTDKAGYDELARLLAHSLNLDVAFKQHQEGGAAVNRGVLARAQAKAKAKNAPVPEDEKALAGTPEAANLKKISATLVEYAGAKKQQQVRELIIEARKLFGEEGKEPKRTAAWLHGLTLPGRLADPKLTEVDREWLRSMDAVEQSF